MAAAPAPRMNGCLTFDPISHTYRLDGDIIPGVTSVLKSIGIVDYSMIPQGVLIPAARRGTAVHLACQLLDEGVLDRSTVDPELEGYVNAYERFLDESRFIPAQIEHRVFHGIYRYAGTLDRTGLLNDSLTILDIKSGLLLPGHAVQIAAYANCLVMPRRFRRIVLELHGDSTYKIHECPLGELQRDIDIFLAALACHNYKIQKGIR